jgi:hypothetical protein
MLLQKKENNYGILMLRMMVKLQIEKWSILGADLIQVLIQKN